MAASIREEQLGSEHPETALSLVGLASIYQEQGNIEQAESLLQRALTINITVYGAEHVSTQTLQERYNSLSQTHKLADVQQEALDQNGDDDPERTMLFPRGLKAAQKEQAVSTPTPTFPCGHLWRPTARFCPDCGQPVEPAETTSLAHSKEAPQN